MNQSIYFKVNKESGYTTPAAYPLTAIIIPDKLPVKLMLGERRVVVSPGEAVILPAGTVYEIASAADRDTIYFDYAMVENNGELKLLSPILSGPHIIRGIDAVSSEKGVYGYLALLSEMPGDKETGFNPMNLLNAIKKLDKTDAFYNTKVLSVLNAFYACLGDMILETLSKEGAHSIGSKVKEHLLNAIDYIDTHYMDEIELADIASVAGYNKTHLSHIFKDYYNTALYDYIMHVRVAKACAALSKGKCSMEELYKSVGFSSSSTFNRVFKRETGYSPRDYKHLVQNI